MHIVFIKKRLFKFIYSLVYFFLILISANSVFANILINELKSNHSAKYALDINYKKMYDALNDLKDNSTKEIVYKYTIESEAADPTVNDTHTESNTILTYPNHIRDYSNELDNIKNTLKNTEIYLADLIISELSNGTYQRKYNYLEYKIYWADGLGVLIHNILDACDVPSSFSLDPIQYLFNRKNNVENAVDLLKTILMDSYLGKNADQITQDMAKYILNLSILCLLDNNFKNNCVESFDKMVNGYGHWLNFATPLYNYNNISIKAYSAISLYELLNNDFTSFNILDNLINKKFTDPDNNNLSGYSEGTGYYFYLIQELLPLYYFGKKYQFLNNNQINKKVLRTADWILKISDPSGYIPSVDDALGTKNVWLAPFAYLNNDNRFIDYSTNDRYSTFNVEKKDGLPCRFLTYPTTQHGSKTLTFENVIHSNGVGKINYKDSDDADISICLIAEDGKALKEGASHDQQDNMNITINRSTDNFLDHLIIDPGYAGFEDDKDFDPALNHYKTKSYNNHNITYPIVTSGSYTYHPIKANSYWTIGDFCRLLKEYGILNTELGVPLAEWWAKKENEPVPFDRPKGAGGGASSFVNQYSNGLKLKINYDQTGYAPMDGGMTHLSYFKNHSNRTVLYFKDDIFIIDNISALEHTIGNNLRICSNYLIPQNNVIKSKSVSIYNDFNVFSATSNSGNSKVQVNFFYEDSAAYLQTISFPTHFEILESDNYNEVTKINFWLSNLGEFNSYVPEEPYDYFNTLTIVEPRGGSFNYVNNYSDVHETNAAICVKKMISNDIDRYCFVNKLNSNTKNTCYIKLDGLHKFETDADFGIFEFNKVTGSMVEIKLYNAKRATINGTNITYRYDEVDLTKQKKEITPIINLLLLD